jgi:hypothetical protein
VKGSTDKESQAKGKNRRIDLSGRKLLGPYGLGAIESTGAKGTKTGKVGVRVGLRTRSTTRKG